MSALAATLVADAGGARPIGAGGGLNFDGLDGLAGLNLRLAQQAVQRLLLELLEPLEVTQKQVAVLWLIKANPGVSQVQLAEALGMDRATTMGIVDRLAARGLVVRPRSKVDRRKQELELTTEGAVLLRQAKALVDQHEQRIARAIGCDMAAVVAALRRLQMA